MPYTDILKDAYDLYSDGEYEAALVAYERAALMGFEVGQSNAAYIYDRVRTRMVLRVIAAPSRLR